MPKATVHGGASYEPPTDEAYADAMTRHGTAAYTESDKLIVDRYRQVHGDEQRAENEERDGAAPGAYGRNADEERDDETREGEQPSVGSSSSTSDAKTPKNVETNETDHQSPAPTTENPSSKARKGNSTAASTAGSGHETPGGNPSR